MPNLVNRLVSRELSNAFKEAEGMIVISFGGLTVKESEGLRTKMAEKGVRMRMVRNSLALRVLKERGLDLGEQALSGNTAIAWGKAEAAIHAAKLFTSADVKKAGKVKVRAGMIEGKVLGPQDAVQLADVPDRNTLNAKILGCLSGPTRGIVTVLNGPPSSLVRLLKARAEKLESAGGTPAG
jgi:large subunit ribosomal protein L10